ALATPQPCPAQRARFSLGDDAFGRGYGAGHWMDFGNPRHRHRPSVGHVGTDRSHSRSGVENQTALAVDVGSGRAAGQPGLDLNFRATGAALAKLALHFDALSHLPAY